MIRHPKSSLGCKGKDTPPINPPWSILLVANAPWPYVASLTSRCYSGRHSVRERMRIGWTVPWRGHAGSYYFDTPSRTHLREPINPKYKQLNAHDLTTSNDNKLKSITILQKTPHLALHPLQRSGSHSRRAFQHLHFSDSHFFLPSADFLQLHPGRRALPVK
jgi:hypothetical protein